MANFEKKETVLVEKIAKEMDKLEATLEKMEDTDSKVKHFYEQEKALHEVKTIIRKENKIEKLEQKAEDEAVDGVTDWLYDEASLVGQINKEVDKLDQTLATIDSDENKVKSYLEQKKAIHEIKKIVKKADQLG